MTGNTRGGPNIYTMRGFISRINRKAKASKPGTKPAIANAVPTPAKDKDELAHAMLGLLKDIGEGKLE